MEINSIIKLDQATKMLAEIRSIDDAKNLVNLAEAARIYAKQVELGLEAQNHAAEIKLRAQRRAGEILDGMDKAKGAAEPGTNRGMTPLPDERASYSDLGITYKDAHVWQKIAAMPEANFEAQLERTKEDGDEITTAGFYRMAKATQFDYKRDNRSNTIQNIYVPQGMDACQTPAYAIDPLISYLLPFDTIWEPAAGEGLIVEALYDIYPKKFQVEASDLIDGRNFFEYEPDIWDCIVTNPPYSIKYQWLERCYELGKPFALLLPVETLGASTAQELFEKYGIEIIVLNRRVNFKMPNKGWEAGGAQFSTAWFTWGMELGAQIVYGKLENH